jgi:hypothetical protein
LHVGTGGENGTIVERLDLVVENDSGRVVGAEFDVGDDVAARIRAGEAYLVINTIEHPDGLIRGQLTPQPARLTEPVPAYPNRR